MFRLQWKGDTELAVYYVQGLSSDCRHGQRVPKRLLSNKKQQQKTKQKTEVLSNTSKGMICVVWGQ